LEIVMTFDISGRTLRWPDGSDGTIHQEACESDGRTGRRQSFVIRLRVSRPAGGDLNGGLRFTAEAHERMPGRDDAEKANAVALKLVSWVAQNGLTDGFFFRVDADEVGVVQISEA
jgi:hypothetical protein